MLVYRQAEGNHGVLIGIDGQHLMNLLRINGQEVSLQIAVGQSWLSADGRVSNAPANGKREYAIEVSSSRYPFQVSGATHPAPPCSTCRITISRSGCCS